MPWITIDTTGQNALGIAMPNRYIAPDFDEDDDLDWYSAAAEIQDCGDK